MGFDSKHEFAPPTTLLGLLLCLGRGVSLHVGYLFTWGISCSHSSTTTSSVVGLTVNSKGLSANGPVVAHASRRPPVLGGTFGSLSCGVTALIWVWVQAKCCLCPPRLESLLPPAFWKSYNQILLALKARFPGDSQSLYQILRLASLTWSSNPSKQCENFFGIIILQSVGHPPSGYRIWFYLDCTPPTTSLQFLLCL